MKILNMMIRLFLVLLIVPVVLGIGDNVGKEDSTFVGGHLIITDVDVKVGSKTDKNLVDGDDISDEAAPGDTVVFSIEVANNFTNEDDVKIEDITITVTIVGIDDEGDDDLEEESNEFDLKDGKDEKKKISFEIPLAVDEDTFDVEILVEGDTDDNGSQEVTMELTIEVQKEDNELRFTRNSLSPSEIKCGRTVQLSTNIINTGSGNEDDVVLEIVNSELGISLSETFDLSDDPFDDDSKFKKTFTLLIPEEIGAGIYTIPSTVTFDDGSDTETETVELLVDQCEIFDDEEEDEDEVVVVQPPVDTTPLDVVTAGAVTTPSLPVTEEKSLFQSSGFLTALIVGEVLLVIVAILIVVAVVRRKGE